SDSSPDTSSDSWPPRMDPEHGQVERSCGARPGAILSRDWTRRTPSAVNGVDPRWAADESKPGRRARAGGPPLDVAVRGQHLFVRQLREHRRGPALLHGPAGRPT